ncbi:MAG: NepR family anti-sigma factor [Hyphomonadaceae bacterium]|nr:NepR family anti-sigma factor [Hyphomonadaceae bacterium]
MTGLDGGAMRFDDRVLMAFAYGELSPEDAARVAAAVEQDAELAARVARFRNVRTALRKVYDSVAEEPVPERLRALLGDVARNEPPPVVASSPARKLSPMAWAMIAAALIVGVLAGRLATPEPLFVRAPSGLAAGAALSRALEEKLSAEAAVDGLRLGGSFYGGDDGVCRTFTADGVSGIACKQSDGWVIRFAVSDGEGPDPGAALMAMVDTMIDGDPLTPAEEIEARSRGWTR